MRFVEGLRERNRQRHIENIINPSISPERAQAAVHVARLIANELNGLSVRHPSLALLAHKLSSEISEAVLEPLVVIQSGQERLDEISAEQTTVASQGNRSLLPP